MVVQNLNSTRKITSGSTTIHGKPCTLREIIINEAGKKCIIVIKDDTTIKHLFMPEYSAIVGKPKVLKVNSPMGTSLVVEMTKLDPVLLLKFNNNSTTTVEDLSGSNTDGTMVNMESADRYEDAERGKALNFSGTDEYVGLGDNHNFTHATPHSITFRIKKPTGSGGGYAISKTDGTTGYAIMAGGDNTLYVWLTTAGGDLKVNSAADAISDDIWTHVTITLDGNGDAAGITCYINGSVISMTTETDALASSVSNANSLCLGAREGPATIMIGVLDEVMIFNRALSAAEAEYLFRNGYGYAAVDGCRLADITLVYEK